MHCHVLTYVGPNTFNENETIAKYEIMDGLPVRGRIMFDNLEVVHAQIFVQDILFVVFIINKT